MLNGEGKAPACKKMTLEWKKTQLMWASTQMASPGTLQRRNGENDEEGVRRLACGQEWSDRHTFFAACLPQPGKLVMIGGHIVLDLIVLGVYDHLGMLLK